MALSIVLTRCLRGVDGLDDDNDDDDDTSADAAASAINVSIP